MASESIKKLYRSRTNRMVAGVCGGIAEYFAMDPTVLRLAMALFALTGFGLIFYLVAIPIVPLEPEGKK